MISVIEWFPVKERLPKKGQEILFINDIRQNPHSLFITEFLNKRFHEEGVDTLDLGLWAPLVIGQTEETPLVSVRHGWVHDAGFDVDARENYVQVRNRRDWSSVASINGSADLVTHWAAMPTVPDGIKR